MKKIIIIFAFILIGLLFIAASQIPSSINKDQSSNNFESRLSGRIEKKEFKVSSGGKLELDLKTGAAIAVEGWGKDLVSIEVEIKGRDSDEIKVEFEQFGNNVVVSSFYNGENNSYQADGKVTVKTPHKYNVDFSTAGGDVNLINLEGKLEGRTMGGNLELSNLKGNLDLKTMGGAINIKDCEVDGSVLTMGGEILVENVTGDLNAKTMGGKVRQVNFKSSQFSGKEVNISTMGGDIEVDRALSGAKVKTMGGDIRINEANLFIDAETNGGDIEVESVNGSVKAKTLGGDVNIKVVGDGSKSDRDVHITSLGGDINLTLPANSSVDIDVEIAYTKNYIGSKDFEDVKVESDFNLTEKRTDRWDNSKGSARKYLYAKGNINSGRNKVKIKTINGTVTIKKG